MEKVTEDAMDIDEVEDQFSVSSVSDSNSDSDSSSSDEIESEEEKRRKKRARVMTQAAYSVKDNLGTVIIAGSTVSSISRDRAPKHLNVLDAERKRKRKENARGEEAQEPKSKSPEVDPWI